MRISGKLHVTPELTWNELKDSSYIPFELAVAQGRNSQLTMGLRAEMKERLTEDGLAFVKYADSLDFKDLQQEETASSLIWWIEKAMQRFPGHTFEGEFQIPSTRPEADDYRIEVQGTAIRVLVPRKVWVDPEACDADLHRLTADSHLLAEAQALLQRASVYALHSGRHVDVNGREGCLGCDMDAFLARNAKTRSV